MHNSSHMAWSVNVTGEFRVAKSSLHVPETPVQEWLPSGTFGVKYLNPQASTPFFSLNAEVLQLAFSWQNCVFAATFCLQCRF